MYGFAELYAGFCGLTLFCCSRALSVDRNGAKAIEGSVIVSFYVEEAAYHSLLSLYGRRFFQREFTVRGLFPLVHWYSARYARAYFGGSRVSSSFYSVSSIFVLSVVLLWRGGGGLSLSGGLCFYYFLHGGRLICFPSWLLLLGSFVDFILSLESLVSSSRVPC